VFNRSNFDVSFECVSVCCCCVCKVLFLVGVCAFFWQAPKSLVREMVVSQEKILVCSPGNVSRSFVIVGSETQRMIRNAHWFVLISPHVTSFCSVISGMTTRFD
jgi:hypothetical protein